MDPKEAAFQTVILELHSATDISLLAEWLLNKDEDEFSRSRANEAFKEIERRHFDAVFSFCVKSFGNCIRDHDARDITQAALFKLGRVD